MPSTKLSILNISYVPTARNPLPAASSWSMRVSPIVNNTIGSSMHHVATPVSSLFARALSGTVTSSFNASGLICDGCACRALGRTYHPNHFTCQGCGIGLSGTQFKEAGGDPYCGECKKNIQVVVGTYLLQEVEYFRSSKTEIQPKH